MPLLPRDRNLQSINEPIVTDVDSGITAIHHTLGPEAFQASPGSHRHDGTDSHKLVGADIDTVHVDFVPNGGTLGTQPTFSGPPMFTGTYTKIGDIVHFAIDVDMDNITNFGSGQYYIDLPLPARRNYLFSDGCLHDISTGDEYAILGHVSAGSNRLTLLSTASNGRQVPFEHNVPVTLSTADNFHIAGTYQIQN